MKEIGWLWGLPSVGLLIAFGVFLLALLRSNNEALTGGAIAVFTLAVNQSFELIRRRSEERRWHAEQFLKDKVDSLRKLFVTLDDWYRTLNYYGNYPPRKLEDLHSKVLVKEGAFLEALAYAQIYLNADDDKAIRSAMASCRMGQMSLIHALPDSEFPNGRGNPTQTERVFPWLAFGNTHDAAVSVLSRLLNPKSLRLLEKSFEGD